MFISKDSHLDHGLNVEHILFILREFGHINQFHMETVDMPEGLAELDCALFGPLMGDKPIPEEMVFYKKRGERIGQTRMFHPPIQASSSMRVQITTRKLSVIIGPHDGQVILYTAFGGPITPREPWDPSLNEKEKAESETFWKQHALLELGI